MRSMYMSTYNIPSLLGIRKTIFSLFFLSSLIVTSQEWSNEGAYFRKQLHTRATGDISGVSTCGLKQCLKHCLRERQVNQVNCGGVNYYHNNSTCQITQQLGSTQENAPEWQYWTVTQPLEEYAVVTVDNIRWRKFWWFNAGTPWPQGGSDVLKDEYLSCDSKADHCFGRLPSDLLEDDSQLLAEDSDGNIYKWSFSSSNSVAHAAWLALHDHQTVNVMHGNQWAPVVVQGTGPARTQDSIQYRVEHGVLSFMLDDDGCDCYSTLSMGHGMCGSTFDTSYGPEYVFGVDLLDDAGCQTPGPSNGLTLYFRDDDDCSNVSCPEGLKCYDGINAYTCK